MNSALNFKNIPSVNILLEELSGKYADIQPVYLKQIILMHLETVRKNPQKFKQLSTKEVYYWNSVTRY